MKDCLTTFFSIYKKKQLQQLAKELGFIKRERQLTALGFLTMLTFGRLSTAFPSLACMVDTLDFPMTRESLQSRFTDEAVEFVKRCLSLLIAPATKKKQLRTRLLAPYTRVLIFDSSSWDVHEKLKTLLPGYGGDASPANCKVQLCYDFLNGGIVAQEITAGTCADNAYTRTIPQNVARGRFGYF